MIEKNVITSLPDKNFMPDETRISLKVMQENNPDWSFHVYSNKEIEAFMKTEFKRYYKFFDMIREEYYVA